MYAGAVVAYKSAYQKSVADSSTEAEFYALVECAKMMLYLRSVLEDLGINQTFATSIFEDNKGAIDIVCSGKPTKRVCHVDTKQFIIIDWVEIDLVDILKISTHDNSSAILTKHSQRRSYTVITKYFWVRLDLRTAHLISWSE